MPVNVEYKELSVELEELKQRPEARRLIPPELFDSPLSTSDEPNSERSTTEGKESAPPHESEPKSNAE